VPRIRIHDQRHTNASLLLQAGYDIKVVSERSRCWLAVCCSIQPGANQRPSTPGARIIGDLETQSNVNISKVAGEGVVKLLTPPTAWR
jgi:hypothetical protein